MEKMKNMWITKVVIESETGKINKTKANFY